MALCYTLPPLERERMHWAVHEAGHAVVARRLRIKLDYIVIAVDREHPLDDCGVMGRVATDENQTVATWRKIRGKTTFALARPYELRRSTIRKDIIHCFAGQLAEREVLGGWIEGGDEGDWEIIDDALGRLSGGKVAKARFCATCQSEAGILVRQSVDQIKAVATALLAQSKLSGAELDRVIAGVIEPKEEVKWQPIAFM